MAFLRDSHGIQGMDNILRETHGTFWPLFGLEHHPNWHQLTTFPLLNFLGATFLTHKSFCDLSFQPQLIDVCRVRYSTSANVTWSPSHGSYSDKLNYWSEAKHVIWLAFQNGVKWHYFQKIPTRNKGRTIFWGLKILNLIFCKNGSCKSVRTKCILLHLSFSFDSVDSETLVF